MSNVKHINERIRDWIESELKRSGKTRKELGQALKLAPSGVTRLLQGQREVGTEELVRLSHFFGDPEAYLHLLMEFYPDSKLVRHPDWQPDQAMGVEEHVTQVRRAMSSALKQVSEMPGVWVVGTSIAKEPYDLIIEDKIITRTPIPIGLAGAQAILCIIMSGDMLSPKYEDGDPIFLVPPGDYEEANPLLVCEYENPEGGERRPIRIGILVGGDPDTGVLTLEHPGSGEKKEIDPRNGIKALYRAATLRELFDL